MKNIDRNSTYNSGSSIKFTCECRIYSNKYNVLESNMKVPCSKRLLLSPIHLFIIKLSIKINCSDYRLYFFVDERGPYCIVNYNSSNSTSFQVTKMCGLGGNSYEFNWLIKTCISNIKIYQNVCLHFCTKAKSNFKKLNRLQ